MGLARPRRHRSQALVYAKGSHAAQITIDQPRTLGLPWAGLGGRALPEDPPKPATRGSEPPSPRSAPSDNPAPKSTMLVGLDEASLEALKKALTPAPKEKHIFDYAEDVSKTIQLLIVVGTVGWGAYLFYQFDKAHKESEAHADAVARFTSDLALTNTEWMRLQIKSDVNIQRVERSDLYHVNFVLHSINASGIPVLVRRNLLTLYTGSFIADLDVRIKDAGALRVGTPPYESPAVVWSKILSEPFKATEKRGYNTGLLGVGQETVSSYDYVIKVQPEQWLAIRSDMCVYPTIDAGLMDDGKCPPEHNQLDFKYCFLRTKDVWSCGYNEGSSSLDGGTK